MARNEEKTPKTQAPKQARRGGTKTKTPKGKRVRREAPRDSVFSRKMR